MVVCSARVSAIEQIGLTRVRLLGRLKLQLHGVSCRASLLERRIFERSAAKVASIVILGLLRADDRGTGA